MERAVQIDSLERVRPVGHILAAFGARKIAHSVGRLYVGDYADQADARTVIDRKQNLPEVCANLTQQHERFRAELERARDAGIRLVILVSTGGESGRCTTCSAGTTRACGRLRAQRPGGSSGG